MEPIKESGREERLPRVMFDLKSFSASSASISSFSPCFDAVKSGLRYLGVSEYTDITYAISIHLLISYIRCV